VSDKPPTPKRGAFPTPKEVIDKASRYVPEPSNSTDDGKGEQTNSLPDRRRSEDDHGRTGTPDNAKESKPE